MSIIEELCVFFNTISGISQLHVNNKGCFDTPSILISIRQHFLKHPDLALKRIAERVRAGGHDVPPEVVRRRFVRSAYNFFHLYRPLLDSWMLFDNSADLPRLIADEESGNLTVIDDKLFSMIERSSR